MDNITHSLIGLAAGDSVARARSKPHAKIWIASAIANNLPDLDVIATTFLFKDKLGYLLHHRGHTHTFLFAPALSLLLLTFLFLVWRRDREVPWKEIIFVSILGPFLHLFADYWNSYGIHPFWPWSNKWIYGDMVFIVEPWIWVFTIPFLTRNSTSRWAKLLLSTLLLGILALAFAHPLVPRVVFYFLAGSSLIVILLNLTTLSSPGKRVIASVVLLISLLTFLSFTSNRLKDRFTPRGSELALTPLPGNPFCWAAIEAKINSSQYEATISMLAAWPGIVPVKSCPTDLWNEGTVSAPPPDTPDSEEQKWIRAFRASREEYDLLIEDCRANAFLRFARTPYWVKIEDGWIVGDLRFDRDKSLSFSEIELPASVGACPAFVPPWVGRFHPEALVPYRAGN